MPSARHSTTVDGIPAIWMPPQVDADRRTLAVWLTGLSGWKELTVPTLERFAELGFFALSIDAFEHGERLRDSREQLAQRADTAFRRTMWPTLGRTVLDVMHVAYWVIDTYDLGASIVAGGVSMGGDIAVALAGIDHRVTRVAAIAATPDWARPGMRRATDPFDVVAQGLQSAEGALLRRWLDPAQHPDRFARRPAVAFELGGDDCHIPAEHAKAFARAVADVDHAAMRRIVVTVHPGLDHAQSTSDPLLLERAIAWMARSDPGQA